MRRARLGLMAVAASVVPLFAGGCGDDATTRATLPPIVTTSTTTTLNVTTTTQLQVYRVQPGDSLGQIAKRFGVSIDDLLALNGLPDPDHIEVGQELDIPSPTTTMPPTTSATTVVVTTTQG